MSPQHTELTVEMIGEMLANSHEDINDLKEGYHQNQMGLKELESRLSEAATLAQNSPGDLDSDREPLQKQITSLSALVAQITTVVNNLSKVKGFEQQAFLEEGERAGRASMAQDLDRAVEWVGGEAFQYRDALYTILEQWRAAGSPTQLEGADKAELVFTQ